LRKILSFLLSIATILLLYPAPPLSQMRIGTHLKLNYDFKLSGKEIDELPYLNEGTEET